MPKLKIVRIKQHRKISQDYRIKSYMISMTPTWKYYVTSLTEYEKESVQKEVETIVGLDFAMDGLYVSSGGGFTNCIFITIPLIRHNLNDFVFC